MRDQSFVNMGKIRKDDLGAKGREGCAALLKLEYITKSYSSYGDPRGN